MLLYLPTELVVQILANLPVIDIVSCQLSCKYLNNVVQENVALKYHMALIEAKTTDNPCSALPLSTKLAQLKNGERSWAVLKPTFSKTIPVKHNPSGIYDLTGGVYLLGNENKHDLHYMRLPSHADEATEWSTIHVGRTIIDMGLCVYEHDLIAVVTTTPNAIGSFGFRAIPTYNIELVLFEFSTGKPHPQAQKHVIPVMNTIWEKPAIGIEIVGDNLVLILFHHRNNAKPDDRVFIYDWRTAVTKTSFAVPYDTYSGLLFLDEHTILLPNTQTNAFDIFRIPAKPNLDSNAHIPMMSLGLPRLSESRTVGGISCRAEPNPIGAASYLDKKKEARDRAAARGDAPLEEDMFPKRGYLASAEDAICIFSLRVLGLQLVNFQFGHSFTFIVHRSAFLDAIAKFNTERDSHKEDKGHYPKMNGTATNRDAGAEHSAADANTDSTDKTTTTTAETSDSSSTRPAPTVKWADWGPSITRWFNSDSIPTRWITTTAGQRCVLIADSAPDTGFPYVVLDFNPGNVRRMKGWMKAKKERDKEREQRLLQKESRARAMAEAREWVESTGLAHDGGLHGPVVDVDEVNEDDNDEWYDVEEDDQTEWDIGQDQDQEPTEYRVGLAIVDEDDIPPGGITVLSLDPSGSASTSPPSPFEVVGHIDDPNTHDAIAGQSIQAHASSNLPETSLHHADAADADTMGLDTAADAVDEDAEIGDSETEFHNAHSTTSSIHETELDIPMGDADADDITDATMDIERDSNNPLEADSSAARRIWCVTSSETVEPAEIFTEPVEGRLQYVACASAQTYIFHGVLMDEERVIGIRTDFMDRIKQIEVHHFG